MNNKNRLFRVTSLLLVLCFVSTVMISGTFAKYTNEYAGADTALVARWSFTGEFDDASFAADLPIWNHTYTTNIYKKEGNDYLIAPGIQGDFKVEFAYDADVDADLTFKFQKSGDASATVPIQYSIDNFTTIYYDLNKLQDAIIATAATDSTSTITKVSSGQYIVKDTATAKAANPAGPISVEQTVSWRWPYNVSVHNAPAEVVNARVAAKTAGQLLSVGSGTGTELNYWLDADDTAIGNSFNGLTRDSYILDLTIAATQRVPGPDAGISLTNVEISGTTTVGQTLTAVLTPATAIATYQWQSSADDITYTNIAGATSKTYTLIATDKDNHIKVIATGMLPEYKDTVTSGPTAKVNE